MFYHCSSKSKILILNSFSEDDDSEPILGHWFEETLAPSGDIMSEVPPPPAPPEMEPTADTKDTQPAEIIGKKEPDGVSEF
jgi:hypothetical protein